MSSNNSKGTLTSATPTVINLEQIKFPCTITLRSAAAGRLMRISSDNGLEYFIPTVTVSTPTMQNLVVTAPVSHVEFTGQAGDTWVTL